MSSSNPQSAIQSTPSLQRGDIYWVNIPARHTVGHEQQKRRPWVIVSNSAVHNLGLVVGIPLSLKSQTPVRHFRIRILQADIALDPGSTLIPGDRIGLTHQIRALSVDRLEPARQGKISASAMAALEAGMAYILDIP